MPTCGALGTRVPSQHLNDFCLLGRPRHPDGTLEDSAETVLEMMSLSQDGVAAGTITLAEVAQKYPSADGALNGCGEAHMFALRELLTIVDNE